MRSEINGYPVLAYYKKHEGGSGTRAGGYVLVDRGEKWADRYITAWAAEEPEPGEGWYWGRYFRSRWQADRDWLERSGLLPVNAHA